MIAYKEKNYNIATYTFLNVFNENAIINIIAFFF